MRVGLVQLTSGDDPAANLGPTEALVRAAAAGGADWVLTPEVTNIVSSSRALQQRVVVEEGADPTLARLRSVAAETGVWLLIGSLALRLPGEDRFANRSFLIDPTGAIVARYDKIHMFDVALGGAETYRESEAFRPGARAVVADTPWGRVGLTICYDIRFPALHRALAQAGAGILTVPAAFTVPTGRAHWEVLLRARAIETGAYVLAPAQSGDHAITEGRPRATWGHSLVVAPWGEVIAEAPDGPGVTYADLDLSQVAQARTRIPSLMHDRAFTAPTG